MIRPSVADHGVLATKPDTHQSTAGEDAAGDTHEQDGAELRTNLPPTVITDKDLEGAPELKGLIHEALSKEYPLNTEGSVFISFEDLEVLLSAIISRQAKSSFSLE